MRKLKEFVGEYYLPVLAAIIVFVSIFMSGCAGRATFVTIRSDANNNSTASTSLSVSGSSFSFNSAQTANPALGAYGGVGGTGGLKDIVADFRPKVDIPAVPEKEVITPEEKKVTPPEEKKVTPPEEKKEVIPPEEKKEEKTRPDDNTAIPGSPTGGKAAIIWKPVADSGGMLVVLLPPSFGRPEIGVYKMDGTLIEKGKYVYDSNPNKPTYRFTKPGKSFPSPCLLKSGGGYYLVRESAKRYDILEGWKL